MCKAKGFTLIELLLVMAVISLLIALLIPALRAAKEQGQRAVCLSNLKQLTLAWAAFATEHDGKIVRGDAFGLKKRTIGGREIVVTEGWVGRAFSPFQAPLSRAGLIESPEKGALWPWIKDIDIYRCPRGLAGHAVTYGTVVAANGHFVEGTSHTGPGAKQGIRVGSTVLKLTRLTDIISPGAALRAVFIDGGQTMFSNDFYVHYLYPMWKTSPPPKHHRDGVTLSMADGHAEYWKWKGTETLKIPTKRIPFRRNPHLFGERMDGPPVPGWKGYEPQTEDGLYDLQRLQRATWGRLGY